MKLNKVLFGMMFTASTFNALAAQAPVVDVSTQNSGATSLVEQVRNLERKLESRNRAQVEVQRQLDMLQSEVNELRGVTELHTHQLSQVLERQRELYQELDRRVSEALKSENRVPTSIAVTNTGNIGQTPSQGYSNNLTENDAYDRALNMVLKEAKYEQAIPAFKTFNKNFPNSTYAPNAHYWLGQLLFNKGALDESKQEFSTVVDKFKASNKRPDAMLKLAMVSQKQNNTQNAINLYRQLLKEYPNSTSAKLAKPRLESLTQ
jgi:tol-pal system protein YbgF